MGALMRSIDWSASAVGPVEGWPQSLRTALSILLETGFPMYIAWGPRFTQFYNDGYRPILGSTKHPAAMGISTRETFAEIWNIIGPMFEGVMQGTPVTLKDFLLPLDRHGFAEECYFDFSYSPIREESGNVGGVLVTVSETSERVFSARRLDLLRRLAVETRGAATASKACEDAAAVLAQSSADVQFAIIYLVDEERAEAKLAGWTGIAPLARIAPPWVDLSGPDPWHLRGVLASREAEVVDCASILGPTGDGDARPTAAFTLPIMTPGADKVSGVLVAGLSPRLSFDAKYRSFLELVAGHIGTTIAGARALEEAKARAEALAEIDRAKTAFFNNVSHEFRTPLTLMLGPAEDALAAGEALPVEDRERWAIVQRSALRLSRLVNTLLDFSRIEADRIEASYEPTDLSALTAELASMFRSAIERAGLRFEVDLPPLEEPAYVDREMWEKIVLNLLSNALKFTFEGGIAISLRAIGDRFELAVRDTGIGVPRAEILFLFDRFHRVKGARARTHEGTGIGLALVSELAKLHGGKAKVESVEGRGSTFSVVIPRGKSHLAADRLGAARSLPSTAIGAAPYVEEALRWSSNHAQHPSAPPAAEERGSRRDPSDGSRARIILADDNLDMREYLARLLRERWDVEAVADGAAALAAIERDPPDLVVSDVMMPELDGFGLLRAIRSNPALRLIPVILVSARAGEEATEEGLAAGANDYIVKPFAARDLLVRVASNLAVVKMMREEREIEDRLRARLYAHFMQAPFPIAIVRGATHVFELANTMALEAWGKDQRLLGQPVLQAIPELAGQPFLGSLDQVFQTGIAHRERAARARLARGPNGALEDVYFDFVYAPLKDGTGAVDGILVSGFEVTAQVQASAEVAQMLARAEASERQFRELVDNLPELAWTAQPDGYIDFYNRRWYEYTGTTFEQMEGWGWTSVHDPARLDAVKERWSHSIDTGAAFEMEFPLRGDDGVFRWFLTRVQPVRDAEGRIIRWFGSNTNIDERRRNDDFKETFLGILGHDLRNPLSTILTTARVMLRRDELPQDSQKRLERVVSSGVRMQRMIDQLLDLTRARLAGGIPVHLGDTPVDLSPLVTKIADEVHSAHPDRAIEVSLDRECRARVDTDRFEQAISNLIGNAVTHGDPTKTIRVALTSRGGSAVIAVHNFGPPIDPSFMPLLFNPFARTEKFRGRSAGLGLGLYISERIVSAHRGELVVQSSEDRGTCFEIILPLEAT